MEKPLDKPTVNADARPEDNYFGDFFPDIRLSRAHLLLKTEVLAIVPLCFTISDAFLNYLPKFYTQVLSSLFLF